MDALPVADKPPPARQSFWMVVWVVVLFCCVAGCVVAVWPK